MALCLDLVCMTFDHNVMTLYQDTLVVLQYVFTYDMFSLFGLMTLTNNVITLRPLTIFNHAELLQPSSCWESRVLQCRDTSTRSCAFVVSIFTLLYL